MPAECTPLGICDIELPPFLPKGSPVELTYYYNENQVLEVIVLPLVVLAIGALFAFARLVVDVDREAITIAFHLLWPKRRIALASVRRAEATKYRPLIDYGGYGVRLGFKGWAFNVSGDEGVLVETTEGARVMIGSRRPKELEAAIALAKHALEGRPREAEPH